METLPIKQVYSNVPQSEYGMINPNMALLVWGRGTGKSRLPVAFRLIDNVLRMPRSITGLVGKSYESLLTKIIPGLINTWEEMGFYENVHYYIGKRPPDYLGWDQPYDSVQRHKNCITFWNGAMIMLFSLDKAFNNGPSLDAIVYDEARFFTKEKVDELNRAIRGNRNRHFASQSCHYSQLYTTDRPANAEERWVYRLRDKQTPEIVEKIKKEYGLWVYLQQKYLAEKDLVMRQAIQDTLKPIENNLSKLRRGCIYYSEASTLDNVDALGVEPIINMLISTTESGFRRGNLNEDVHNAESQFYHTFGRKNKHSNPNISYIDSLDLDHRNIVKDCRWDGDWQPHIPIDVGIDYGKRINCLVAAQPYKNDYRIINGFFVTDPLRTKHVIDKFCKYYRYHKNKVVNLYYDSTGKAGSTMTTLTQIEDATDHFKKNGWRVRPLFIGQASSHYDRFLFYEKAWNDEMIDMPHISVNHDNCDSLIISIESTNTIEKNDIIYKDKSPEQGPLEVQHHTTHFAEAMDMIIYGKFVRIPTRSRGKGMGAKS